MKKTYIIPFVTIEGIEEESLMQQFSKVDTGPIGEGDSVTNGGQLGNGTATSGDGNEGMNAKGSSFQWDFDFE